MSEAPLDLLRGLAVLAEPPGAGHQAVAGALGLGTAPTPADYADVFLFQLYPYASVYLGPEGMLGGEARDRVAGFWRALGYTPPAEPDHLTALLGLYTAICEREAEHPDAAERRLLAEGRRALLDEHLAPWAFPFLERVAEVGGPIYRAWAELAGETLRREVERDAGAPLRRPTAHLRDVPPLPDPRAEGAGPFLAGLLAPARSGFVLTRADLARLAAAGGLGLRAGERRYALEHLLAQDAAFVLRGLAAEAERQGVGHAARTTWLGPAASHFAERCARSAALLRVLATDADALEAAGPAHRTADVPGVAAATRP